MILHFGVFNYIVYYELLRKKSHAYYRIKIDYISSIRLICIGFPLIFYCVFNQRNYTFTKVDS